MNIKTAIDTTEIERTSALVSTPPALRAALKRTQSAKTLHRAFVLGTIPIDSVSDYVQELTGQFERGVRFPYEPELCLLAVVLEESNSPIADQFLKDLSRVRVAELPMSPKVAEICLNARRRYPRNKIKVYRSSSTILTHFEVISPLPERSNPAVKIYRFSQETVNAT